MTHRRVDLNETIYTEEFDCSPIYRKNVTVKIRPAAPGERLTTVLANGQVETTKTAGLNEYVVTNPGGEEYIIDEVKFINRYDSTDQPGIYKAKGRVRAFPFTGKVVITAPWGEDQYGDYGMFACTLDENDRPTDNRYIIGMQEFNDTYVLDTNVTGC